MSHGISLAACGLTVECVKAAADKLLITTAFILLAFPNQTAVVRIPPWVRGKRNRKKRSKKKKKEESEVGS